MLTTSSITQLLLSIILTPKEVLTSYGGGTVNDTGGVFPLAIQIHELNDMSHRYTLNGANPVKLVTVISFIIHQKIPIYLYKYTSLRTCETFI